MDEQQLIDIHWRATRGCHHGDALIMGSKYAEQVIEKDVHLLIVEVRRLQAELRVLAEAGE